VKTGTNEEEFCKEGYGSKSAILSIVVVVVSLIWTNKRAVIYKEGCTFILSLI
jgi:hypothetical protein